MTVDFPLPECPVKVDPVVKGQGSVFYVMPVVQADPGQGFKSLILHLPLLLRGMSQAARAHRLPIRITLTVG